MKKLFAIPIIGNKLCQHFGHCEQFAILETQDNKVVKEEYVTPPVHKPGVYPQFLAKLDVNTIISGGMGMRAKDLFAQNNIEVYVGVSSDSPTILVNKYLEDQLESGQNLCDH